jgi:hypothetical protein
MKPNCASAVLAPKVTTPATRTALSVDWATIDWAMDVPRRNLRQASGNPVNTGNTAGKGRYQHQFILELRN